LSLSAFAGERHGWALSSWDSLLHFPLCFLVIATLRSFQGKKVRCLYRHAVSQIFPDHLTSTRLLLRRLQHGDAAALCAYRSLPDVAQYQSWVSFGTDDAVRLIDGQSNLEPGIPGTWFQLAIVERATEIMVGDCGLRCRHDDPRQMEIGVTLAPFHQGRGYATEGLACLLDFVFGTLGAHRVSAITDAENQAADSLFRRLGFRQEGSFVEHVWFKGQWGSELSFAMLKREWNRPAHSSNIATKLLDG
jgi:RimJ/RimL family protein N-acetyltransferase